MSEIKEQILDCLQDEKAFCTAACPFHLEIRDFIEKIRRGSFDAAFKVYRNAVGFPEIVNALCGEPCKKVCPRSGSDAAIEVRLLEKASISYARNINPTDYNVPRKQKKIAVIGAGVSGLACALRLAAKKYQITVFEQNGRIGGHLWGLLPPELFLADLERQFMYEKYTLHLNTRIESLDELDDDAIYVATGKNGEDFGVGRGENSFASSRPGVFLGGSLLGANSVEAVAHGLQVINSIERYLKTGSMNHPEEDHRTKMILDPRVLSYLAPVAPADGAAFSREEAVREAGRCLCCSCDSCRRHCDLLNIYKKYPKRLKDEVDITVEPATMDGAGMFATRLIASCTQCGLCKEVCPKDIDLGDFLLKSRRAMAEKGSMPWAFHDYWLRDMSHAGSDAARLSRLPGGYRHSAYMFFPGCQLGASDPRYVSASYRYLLRQKPDTALLLDCCGAPAFWAGEEQLHREVIERLRRTWEDLGRPKAVFACPTCKQMFEKFLPEIQGVFLYPMMLELGISPEKSGGGQKVSVFDPCSSRNESDVQQSVRALVEQAGFQAEALPYEGKWAQCCSWGGHVSIANPSYADQVTRRRIGQSDHPYIAYCSNCRDIFAAAGKSCVHLLDLLFDLNGDQRKPPLISQRRENRSNLKEILLREFWGVEDRTEPKGEKEEKREGKNLLIEPELRQKLSDELILETDIEAVVRHCEESGEKIFHPESGHYFGHLRIGFLTYWVEYRGTDRGLQLINAYSHRMSIDNG